MKKRQHDVMSSILLCPCNEMLLTGLVRVGYYWFALFESFFIVDFFLIDLSILGCSWG